jgi:hypothetical protein
MTCLVFRKRLGNAARALEIIQRNLLRCALPLRHGRGDRPALSLLRCAWRAGGVGVRHCTALQCDMWWQTSNTSAAPRHAAPRGAVPHGRLCRTGLRLRQRRRHAMVHIIKIFLAEVSEAVGMAAWHVTRGMARVTRHAAWHVSHVSCGMARAAHQSRRLPTGRECLASHRIVSRLHVCARNVQCARMRHCRDAAFKRAA